MLKREVIDRRAVIGHLRSVLSVFASKPESRKICVGITGDAEARPLKHRRSKPDFRLLVTIYSPLWLSTRLSRAELRWRVVRS